MQQVSGIEDSTSAPRNLLVAQSVNLVDELALSAACEDDVRMRVAPRWQHHSAFRVDSLVEGARRHSVGNTTERSEATVLNGQPCVVDSVERRHLFALQAQLRSVFDASESFYIID